MTSLCNDCLVRVYWFAKNSNMFQVCQAWFCALETTKNEVAAAVFLERFPVYAPLLPDIHSHVLSALGFARKQRVWKAPKHIWMKAPVVLLGVVPSKDYACAALDIDQEACAAFDGDQLQLFDANKLCVETARGHRVVVRENTLVVCSSFQLEELLIFGCDADMDHCWLLARFDRSPQVVWPFDD